jgi:pimeloyl-ACP methyl ester carboxylesterase
MNRWTKVATLLAACVAAGAAVAGSASASPTRVAWNKCYSDLGPFQCGTVQVPLDYDSPNGATISLALVRLPASDPAHRIGSLFLNPGGPGGSGVDFTLFAGPFLYGDSVRARFDLVGFDPRGIGRSTALRCFGTPKQWGPYFTPFAFPTTPAEETQWMNADLYLDGNCAQRGGAIADHMSTANVVRDLDQLRQAVGDAKLTYAGYSYGTMIGQTYANMFPGNVRAIIIDGVLDPIAWTTGSGDGSTVPFSTRLRSDAGAQATLQEFFRLCDAGACAFGPHAASRFAALAAAVKARPVVVTNPDGSPLEVNYSILIAITLGAMYDSLGWEDFAQTLADFESAAANPAGFNRAALGARIQPYLGTPAYINKRGFPHYSNNIEGFPAVACADSDNPHSYAAWSSAGAAADAATGYFGRIWTWASSLCAAWPHADTDRYVGPWTAQTANPVLVVGNQFDPATRYQGAQRAAGLLPGSRLLTVHGWGHTSLFRSSCADEAASNYLVSLVLPPAGTVCQQDHVPFTP